MTRNGHAARADQQHRQRLDAQPGRCNACGSERIELLGALGRRLHFRCKMCWYEWSRADYT